MSFIKNAKNRIIAFVVGAIMTVAGLVMLYFDFFGKKDQWYSDTSSYSIAIFFIGIAAIMIAFERKKKAPAQKKENSQNPGETNISANL